MGGVTKYKDILLEILRVGLLRIRAFGNERLPEACTIEADHLHNIPQLIRSGGRNELLYYYDVERPASLKRSVSDTEQFKPQWDRLASLLGNSGTR